MKSDIKAILFDLVGVLLFKRSDYKPNRIIDEVDKVIGKVIDDSKFKEETMQKYNFTKEEFNDVLESIVNKYEANQPLWDLLPQLKEYYKLGIINNGTGLTLPRLKSRYPIGANFDIFISSAIEGVGKPDQRIYLTAVKKFRVEPRQCLFMDDSLENIKGAEKVGMKVIWWENRDGGFEKFKGYLSI